MNFCISEKLGFSMTSAVNNCENEFNSKGFPVKQGSDISANLTGDTICADAGDELIDENVLFFCILIFQL